jgi:hypothetical protein
VKAILLLLIALLVASCAQEACPAYQMTYAQSAKRYKPPRYKTNRMLLRSDGHTRIKISSPKSSKSKTSKAPKLKKQTMAEQE